MVTDEELKAVYGMFTDAWKLYKKYADVQQEDEYWESLIAEADAIAKKHQNNKLCRDLILAAMSELERKSKDIQKMQHKKEPA
ncbi:MAG: hypothetical protein HDR03_08380 [Lachnospiraceae bacterium]|nr:hypothetical protein [Lachnospiraceae bacterium]